jgi:hypothetical protein
MELVKKEVFKVSTIEDSGHYYIKVTPQTLRIFSFPENKEVAMSKVIGGQGHRTVIIDNNYVCVLKEAGMIYQIFDTGKYFTNLQLKRSNKWKKGIIDEEKVRLLEEYNTVVEEEPSDLSLLNTNLKTKAYERVDEPEMV